MRKITAFGIGAIIASAVCSTPGWTFSEAERRSPRPFDISDTHPKSLAALYAAALELERQEKASAQSKVAAWQAVYDASRRVEFKDRKIKHPLAGVALAHLASARSGEGDAAGAVASWQRAIAILRPHREIHAAEYVIAVAALARELSSTLGKSSEAIAELGQTDQWYRTYLAAVPIDRRTAHEFTAETDLAIAYGEVLSDLDRAGEAVGYKRSYWEAMKRVRGPNHPDANAGQWSYAMALFSAGKSDEAESNARQAVQVAIDHISPTEATFSQSFSALAILLARRGKRFEALEFITRSIELQRKAAGDNPRIYATLYNYGDVLTALEQYEAASAAMLEAAEGWRAREGASSVKAALATARAGIADFADGRLEDAAARMAAAQASARAADANENRVSSTVQPLLGLAYRDLGRTEEARQLTDRNLAKLRATAQPYPIELAVAELAAAYLAQAGSDAARITARRVIEIERTNRDIIASGELAQGDRTALDLVLRVATAANDAQLALDAMNVLAGSKVAQANRLLSDRLVHGDSALAARLREQQDAARALKQADSALLKVMAVGSGIGDASSAREKAATKLAALKTALVRDYPAWTDANGVTGTDLPDLQRDLREEEAILSIVPAFDGVYTLLITRSDTQVRRVPLSRRALSDLVSRLRISLPAGRFDRSAAHALYEQFFPQADAHLLRRVTSLKLVPAGIFAALPFGALLQKTPTPEDRRPAYLIRRFAITVASGINPIELRPDVPASNSRFLGIGAPTGFGRTATAKVQAARMYFRNDAAHAGALADLPPLPNAASEIARVARGFGPKYAEVLLGDEASEATLKSMDLTRFSTILFATHGLVSGEMDGVSEPALVLARPSRETAGDGLLTASEIASLKLDADWIILSACNTAAGSEAEAPAYSGLAQAFRYAGARTLLLSHWPVRDDAAAFISVKAIASARKGLRRDVALQRATIALLDSRTIANASDPYIWAPYMLLGDVRDR